MNTLQDKKELTVDESLNIIGQALAHKNLKLSQGEHLLIIEAYNKIEKELKKDQP